MPHKKAVCIAIGIKLDGTKEVMGMWIGGNESAKYWIGVLNEIRNRGTEDILIASADGLTGFNDAIHVFILMRKSSAALFTKFAILHGLSHTKISSPLWLI